MTRLPLLAALLSCASDPPTPPDPWCDIVIEPLNDLPRTRVTWTAQCDGPGWTLRYLIDFTTGDVSNPCGVVDSRVVVEGKGVIVSAALRRGADGVICTVARPL